MFGVGWTEMLVIGVVALIVIGPKDLPVVMHRIGKFVASIRRMGSDFQREINKTTGLDTITDLRRSLTDPLKQTAAEITREFNRTTPDGKTEPSGVIAPKAPNSESVVDEIQEKVGMKRAEPAPVESPAPVEAITPAEATPAARPRPTRKPRAKKTTVAAAPAPEVPAVEAPVKRPAAAKTPRKRRTAKPKTQSEA